jgi:hypothetical protein
VVLAALAEYLSSQQILEEIPALSCGYLGAGYLS